MRTPEEVAREVWQAVADSIHRDDQSAHDALAGLTYESCGTNRLGQPTRRLVGPVEVGEP